MISQQITLNKLYNSKRWNAEYFIDSSKKLKKSDRYNLTTIGELLIERKELLSPLEYRDWKFNYIGLENISQNTRMLVAFKPKLGAEIKSRCKVYREGDILYGRLRPKLNKCLLIDERLTEGICSTEIFVLMPNLNLVIPEYIAEILVSPLVLQRVGSVTAGAALPRMQICDFFNLQIPIPSLEIQQKIANKVREMRTLYQYYIHKANIISTNLPSQFLLSIEEGVDIKVNLEDIQESVLYKNLLPPGKFFVRGRKS